MIQSSGNLVISENKKKVVLIGVNDMIVVENGDALLLCKNHTHIK